jgi:hypothetical protein
MFKVHCPVLVTGILHTVSKTKNPGCLVQGP